MTPALQCDDCGETFDPWDAVIVVQHGRWDGSGVTTYGSDYYHDGCEP